LPVRSVAFLLREFGHSLRQNRFLHFTYGAQVTVSLLVLGIFFVLLVGAALFWNKLGEAMEIHAYLDDDISAIQISAMEDTLRGMAHVTVVEYRSKEDAMRIFGEKNKAIKLDDLQMDNPFPNSYVVKVDRPTNIEPVALEIGTMTGVESTRYGREVLDRYIKVLMILASICLVTITLLILFTYSSINNIIALSIYARRAEIRIMQLVGATWWFIRWPFLFEGLFFGLTGAAAALVLIVGLMTAIAQALKLSELSLALPNVGVDQNTILIGLGLMLLGLGMIVGFFGSLRTVNTFLQREAGTNIGPAKRTAG
jgi:cell division transport system permease protein